jgi:hypothetical protein
MCSHWMLVKPPSHGRVDAFDVLYLTLPGSFDLISIELSEASHSYEIYYYLEKQTDLDNLSK